jgi:hypothetical protein
MRRKVIHVSDSLWAMLFRAGDHHAYAIVADALPHDARCVGVEKRLDYVALAFESAEFDEVPEGQTLPVLAPMFRLDAPTTPGGADSLGG